MAKDQYAVVMEEFKKGRLRDKSGKKITDPKRAKAVATNEQNTADERGRSKRTFKGHTRLRPKLKGE